MPTHTSFGASSNSGAQVVAPTRSNTTAGRLLSRRGDGGYMIIMQTLDAVARRSYIESKGLSKVIYAHEHDDAVCIQYHPKGIKGTDFFLCPWILP